MLTGAGHQTTNDTPLLSHEFGSDCRPPDEPSDTDDRANDDPHARTAYQLCLTDIPDEDSDASKDPLPYTGSPSVSSSSSDAKDREASQYGDLSADSDTASVHSHASSAAYSAPLDHSHEEYIDWLCAGCPDSDTEYISDSD
jgi:hypothetical protein